MDVVLDLHAVKHIQHILPIGDAVTQTARCISFHQNAGP